jgi:hypothetical protein
MPPGTTKQKRASVAQLRARLERLEQAADVIAVRLRDEANRSIEEAARLPAGRERDERVRQAHSDARERFNAARIPFGTRRAELRGEVRIAAFGKEPLDPAARRIAELPSTKAAAGNEMHALIETGDVEGARALALVCFERGWLLPAARVVDSELLELLDELEGFDPSERWNFR